MSDQDKWVPGQHVPAFRGAAENTPEIEADTETPAKEPPEPSHSSPADGPPPPGGASSNASVRMDEYDRDQHFASFEQEDYNRDLSTDFNNSVENDAGDQSL